MPTVVEIPNVGVVEFPDGMSQDDVARESESLYSRHSKAQPTPREPGFFEQRFNVGALPSEQPSAGEMLQTMETPEFQSKVEEAKKQAGAAAISGQPPVMRTLKELGEKAVTPAVRLARMTPQMVQDAFDFMAPYWAAAEPQSPFTFEEAQRLAGEPSRAPTAAAKVTSGLINAAETVPETFTSPLGVATLGAGQLGATGARLVSGGFAIHMLANTPAAVNQWREALKMGDAATISEASAGLALHGLMTVAAGRHAVTSPRTIQAKQLARAIGLSEAEAARFMETPEWQAAVERAAIAGAKPIERFAPQTAEALREMGTLQGQFIETGPRAPGVVVTPPVEPPMKVEPVIETPKPELQPATPELKPTEVVPPVEKGVESALQERKSEEVPVEVPPVSGEAVGAQIREPERPAVPRPEAEGKAPEAPPAEVKPAEAEPAAPEKAPVEAATKMQAEVSDVAKTQGQRPAKAVKKDLIAELEKAVAEAPNSTQDYFPGLYVFTKEAYIQGKIKLSQSGLMTDRPVEGTKPLDVWLEDSAKDQNHPTWKNKDTELGRKMIGDALTRKQVPKVTIEIPGDGTFTVWKTKDALQGLLDRARKLSTSTEPPKGFKESKPTRVQGQEWMKEAEVPPEKPSEGIVGMGGAVPGEFEQRPQTATGIKNATVDKERALRGLPPAMEPARRSFQTVWDEAMSIVDREPERQDALIAELAEKPRAITDVEDALLLQRQIDLQNEFGKATRDLAQAYEDKRMADVADQRTRVDFLSEQLLKLYNINKSVGTETGRGLAARKMMAYEDFTLAAMETQKRAAKGGEPLTDAERTQIETLNKRIEETQKAYDAEVARLQQRLSEFEAQRLLEEEKAKAKPPEPPPEVKSLVERVVLTLEREADAARIRLREKFARTSAGVDPTILSDVAIIGTAKLARGTLTLARWTEAMIKDLGEQVRPYLKDAWDMANKGLDTRIEQMAGSKQATPVKKVIKKTETAEIKKDATTRIAAKVASNQTAEISPLVQKLARAIVAENPKITRDQLITEVHDVLKEIIPEITKREAMDAISGYGQFKQLTKDEVSKTLRDLKGQMQQVAKIEDIESKKPPLKTGIERREPSAEERKLIKLVNEAKRRFGIVVTDPATQLKSALDARKTYYRNQIQDLQAQIDAKQKFIKTKTPSPTDPELESLIKRRDEVKQKFDELFPKGEMMVAQRAQMLRKALERSIAEYERRLREGDFVTRKPKPFDVSQHPELMRLKSRNEALKEEFRKGLLLDRMKRRPIGQKIYDVAKEIVNLPRNVLSSWDVSAVLRQGGFIVFGHPIRGAQSLGPMFRALASQKAAREIDTQIHARPNAPLYARSKLYLAPLEDLRLTAQEEMIMSRFAHRVPGLRASNRAFITFLNKLRADSFDTMTAALGRDRPLEQVELDAISNYINVATGRGNLGKAAAAAETLATVFFSPRLMASRFQLLAGEPLYRGSMRTRTAIAKEYGRLLIGLGVIYGLGQLAGATIEEDPRSSDFGKLRFGDTRVDPLMGLSQVTTLAGKVISGERKTAAGRILPIRGKVPYGQQDTSDVVKQFLRSKLSPVVGGALDIATGKNVVGEEVTPTTVVTRLAVPLAFNDILDVMEENGIARGTAIQILSLFGMGVQNYEQTRRPR